MKEAIPINVCAIDHVVIRAVDLDKMIRFYADVLGCRLERGPGDLGLAQLRAGHSLIDLVDINGKLGNGGTVPDPKVANMDHLCLQIRPWNEAVIREHLQRNGISVGSVVTRYGAKGNGPSLYLDDPEGNTVELKGVN